MCPSNHTINRITDFYAELFRDDYEIADVSIAIVLSSDKDIEGDNQALAEVAKRLRELRSDISLYVQWEVYCAAKFGFANVNILINVVVDHPHRFSISKDEMLEKYVAIYNAQTEQLEELPTVLLVCHPELYSDAKECLEKNGVIVWNPPGAKEYLEKHRLIVQDM